MALSWQGLSVCRASILSPDNTCNALFGFSGNVGLCSGSYGSILAGFECTQGFYPVTTAFLNFLTTFISPFSQDGKENELMAPILFLLREIFPVFQKWRFYQARDMESIGKCDQFFIYEIRGISNPNFARFMTVNGRNNDMVTWSFVSDNMQI